MSWRRAVQAGAIEPPIQLSPNVVATTDEAVERYLASRPRRIPPAPGTRRIIGRKLPGTGLQPAPENSNPVLGVDIGNQGASQAFAEASLRLEIPRNCEEQLPTSGTSNRRNSHMKFDDLKAPFEPAPEGSHVGVLEQFIHRGQQPGKYPRDQASLSWLLPIVQASDGQPCRVFQTIWNLSLRSKAVSSLDEK
jgi:hypothetical protein